MTGLGREYAFRCKPNRLPRNVLCRPDSCRSLMRERWFVVGPGRSATGHNATFPDDWRTVKIPQRTFATPATGAQRQLRPATSGSDLIALVRLLHVPTNDQQSAPPIVFVMQMTLPAQSTD